MKKKIYINKDNCYIITHPISCPFRYSQANHEQCTIQKECDCLLVEFPEACLLEDAA